MMHLKEAKVSTNPNLSIYCLKPPNSYT